jgi:TMEM175 potassium channel family protein
VSTLKTEPDFVLHTHRIEALADGVFAIVMTLLVLGLDVPNLPPATGSADLGAALLGLWPKLLCYVTSFVTLGVYWVAHHLHFYSIKRADRVLLWINILFLMTIGLVPFSTALLGEHYRAPVAATAYGANMMALGLILQLHWWYATRGRRLVSPDLEEGFVRSVSHVILLGPAVYLVAVLLGWLSTSLALVLFLLVNLIYILPGGAHLYLRTDHS